MKLEVFQMRISVIALLCCLAFTQSHSQSGDISGMDMSHMNGNKPAVSQDTPGTEADGVAMALHSMEGHHMDMGPHMKMTSPRKMEPGDQAKADQIVQEARAAVEKYKDYKVALGDGFRIFLPNVPQKQYHFTNYRYAWQARNHFDPSHPTSLLYEKDGDGYKLIGLMYTAKKDTGEDELNSRVPLSIAQWHAHVNLCMPPRDRRQEALLPNAKFGLRGSIATKEECDAAGGKFYPQVFGWMVHVYPFEQKAENIWSVERQIHDHMD
jgi:hypothetical protein